MANAKPRRVLARRQLVDRQQKLSTPLSHTGSWLCILEHLCMAAFFYFHSNLAIDSRESCADEGTQYELIIAFYA